MGGNGGVNGPKLSLRSKNLCAEHSTLGKIRRLEGCVQSLECKNLRMRVRALLPSDRSRICHDTGV